MARFTALWWGTTCGDDRHLSADLPRPTRLMGCHLMSQPESSSYSNDLGDAEEAVRLADQMKAATSSLRARLSLVPDAEDAGGVSGSDV